MLTAGVSTTDSYVQFITVLILFVFVLAVTYVTTRWIANYQKGKAAGGNLEIVEAIRAGNNKYIQIVRAGSKYLIIGVGKDEIHMLGELSEDELVILKNKSSEGMDFGSILEKLKKRSGKDND